MTEPLISVLKEVHGCRLCADTLALGPRPVLQAHKDAVVLVAGQAPGTRVHASGIPFDDASGDRLRDWMGVDKELFYDPKRIAILPMAFCYPGKGRSGDLAPPPLCAETWRTQLLGLLPNIKLTLAIGRYAQNWHLGQTENNLTETVRAWARYGPGLIPLPHPSPRNNIWLRRNPWFELEVLPHLKRKVRKALSTQR